MTAAFVVLGALSFSTLSSASNLNMGLDVDLEGYKTRFKGYMPSSLGTLGSFSSGKGNGVPCDANKQSGYPNPWTGTWETANAECPGEDIAWSLRNMAPEKQWEAFPELRNKSILFAGDSVGRHLFEWFCMIGQTEVKNTKPEGFEYVPYGWSSTCEIPGLGMKVAQIHIYSLVNTSDPYARDIVEKWFPGGIDWDLQSRTERFFETTLKGFTPDYVHLNSGPWDFRYWFLRDVIEGKRADDLALEDRETAARVAVQSLQYFQARWPGVKVWYMHPPMADEDDFVAKKTVADPVLGLKEGHSLKEDQYPPFYTYRRQAQYRATMVQRLREAGHDSLDYAQIQLVTSPRLFFKEGDAIHPQKDPKWTMANMILTKMARHARFGV